MSDMEDTVKKHIVGLLTSSPLTITISQLNRDYKNIIGEEIPYHKLGYNSLEHFLKSVPDTVQVIGNGFMATVLLVGSEKSKHITQLISKQKIDKKKFLNRFALPTQQRKHLQYQKPAFTNSINQPQRKKIFYPPSDCGSSFQNVSDKPVQNVPDKPVQNVSDKSVQNTLIHQNGELSDIKKDFAITKSPEKSPNDYQRILDSHRPKNASQANDESNILNASGCGRTKKLQCLLDRIPDELSNIDNKVPLRVRENLKHLIGKHEDGIWCAELPRLYRQMFHTDINYEGLGFVSLSQLCISLPSIFHYSRPAHGDFKLYDKSKPLPASAETKFTVASYTVGKRLSTEENISAVPNINWDDVANFLPENVFKPGNEIPRQFIPPDTKEGDTIQIAVGEVYDLSKFWVYLDDGRLDNLMDELQDFYQANGLKYLMPANLIREGIYCVQTFYNDYHRAFIVDVLPEADDTVKVLFIDYGTMTKVPSKGICFLHEQFADLPAQAIRCRLADICPPEQSVPWSREASSKFRLMVRDRQIDAKVARINWKEQILEAYLIDVSKQYCLNTKLVERGFAQYPDQALRKPKLDSVFQPLVKYIHLFPTFLELEHGYAPSTQEMAVLMNCGVPTSLCYPQYFSVDTSEEKQTILETEEYFSTYAKKNRACKSNYMDMSCVVRKRFDLSLFGDLASEIAEFMEQNEAYAEYFEDETSEDITRLYEQLEEMKKETAEKIQQDRELAEDIMRDLEFLKYEDAGSCSETCGSDENREGDSEMTMYTARLIGSGESGSEGLDFDKYKSGSSDASELLEMQDKNGFFDVECNYSSKNTNPFLSECWQELEQDEQENGPLMLNPSNPFLSYLSGKYLFVFSTLLS
nr:unnamed protein product [Callosobruchus analis]